MARKAIYKHATQVDANTYPDDGTSPVGTTEWNQDPAPQGMYGNTPTTSTIAIASGVATPTDSVSVVTSESSTTDTLDKLAITNTNEYDLIYLFGNTGHTITLTHTASPNADGQVVTVGGANETLSTTKPTILMRKGTYWYGYGGGTVADGSITTAKIADNAVTGAKIALGSDAAGDIMYYNGTDYIRLAKGNANEVLQMGGSNAPEWGTVQATEIAANAVGSSELADDAVDTAAIAADAVTAAKIGDDVINSEHYAAGSIDLEHMSSQSVDEDNLHVSNAPTNGYMLTAQSGNAGGLTWAASGGGNHTEQGWDVYTTHTGSTTASDGIAYMFARKIDSNNDGLYIMLWKNGASTEVQIA